MSWLPGASHHEHHTQYKGRHFLRGGGVLLECVVQATFHAFPALEDYLPGCCDCCAFDGLSITLYALYLHWYQFSYFIKSLFISICGSSLLLLIPMLCWIYGLAKDKSLLCTTCAKLPLVKAVKSNIFYTVSDELMELLEQCYFPL